MLANYGLESLRFVKPVYIGDTIRARLTCKQKTAKDLREGEVPQGVVAWDVEVFNQADEPVAVYTILTLVQRKLPETVEVAPEDAVQVPRDEARANKTARAIAHTVGGGAPA